jgi:hypothetical protein
MKYLLVDCEMHVLHMIVYHFNYWATKLHDRKLRRYFACTIDTLSMNHQGLLQLLDS